MKTTAQMPFTEPTTAPQKAVTFRAILLALLIMPFNSLWIVETEAMRYAGHPTTISLFYNVVFILLALTLVNAGIKKLLPRAALNPGELLTVYAMLTLSSAVTGHDFFEVLTPILTHVSQFATDSNGWRKEFLPSLPPELIVTDPAAIQAFYQGGSFWAHLGAWVSPILWWSSFFTALLLAMLFISTLIRRQWTEREHLSYPLVQLPYEIATGSTHLFKNRLFWIGVFAAVGLDTLNGLHELFPFIPALRVKYTNMGEFITARPWNAIGWLPVSFYPFAIALGVLLPVDLSFSAWFFYWMWKAQLVLTALYGYDSIRGFPYVTEQTFGAYLGLASFALWVSRKHFVNVAKSLFNPRIDLDDANEPIRYRAAAWGMIACFVFLYWFCARLGMTWWVILMFFLIYFMLSVGITRMRAELGPPAHDMHNSGPGAMIPRLFGFENLSRQDLNFFTFSFGFNRAYRSHPMPFMLEGYKLAEKSNLNFKGFFWAMALASVFGIVIAFVSNIALSYHHGVGTAKLEPPFVPLVFGSEAWARHSNMVKSPTPYSPNTLWASSVGFVVVIALQAIRLQFPQFPFHPVGYAVSSSWSLGVLWMPMFIAWFLKASLLHFGGLKAYRNALPFFFGVIVGECVMGSLWTLIGILFDIRTYAIFP